MLGQLQIAPRTGWLGFPQAKGRNGWNSIWRRSDNSIAFCFLLGGYGKTVLS
jgi:hypothetical protein